MKRWVPWLLTAGVWLLVGLALRYMTLKGWL